MSVRLPGGTRCVMCRLWCQSVYLQHSFLWGFGLQLLLLHDHLLPWLQWADNNYLRVCSDSGGEAEGVEPCLPMSVALLLIV